VVYLRLRKRLSDLSWAPKATVRSVPCACVLVPTKLARHFLKRGRPRRVEGVRVNPAARVLDLD